MLRSSVGGMNWKACMFCRDTTVKEKQQEQLYSSIASKYDPVIHARLSGVPDLMVPEGKYYNRCYHAFRRSTRKTEQSASQVSTVAMEWLVAELKETAKLKKHKY